MLKVDIEKNLLSSIGNFKLELNFEMPKEQFFPFMANRAVGKLLL